MDEKQGEKFHKRQFFISADNALLQTTV